MAENYLMKMHKMKNMVIAICGKRRSFLWINMKMSRFDVEILLYMK